MLINICWIWLKQRPVLWFWHKFVVPMHISKEQLWFRIDIKRSESFLQSTSSLLQMYSLRLQQLKRQLAVYMKIPYQGLLPKVNMWSGSRFRCKLFILLAIISFYVLDYFNVVIILHDSMLQCKRDTNLCYEPCKKVDEREESWIFIPGCIQNKLGSLQQLMPKQMELFWGLLHCYTDILIFKDVLENANIAITLL